MFFYDQATHTVEASSGQLTWGKMRESMGDLLYKLSSMKFEVRNCFCEDVRTMKKMYVDELLFSFRILRMDKMLSRKDILNCTVKSRIVSETLWMLKKYDT
jgi:hypothetical protein